VPGNYRRRSALLDTSFLKRLRQVDAHRAGALHHAPHAVRLRPFPAEVVAFRGN